MEQRLACFGATFYLLNPAALADLSYWGQPDSVYVFFLIVTVGALTAGSLSFAFAALTFAVFAKPQAWALAPFLGVAGLMLYPSRMWGRAASTAIVIALLIIMPYALAGRLSELSTLPIESETSCLPLVLIAIISGG